VPRDEQIAALEEGIVEKTHKLFRLKGHIKEAAAKLAALQEAKRDGEPDEHEAPHPSCDPEYRREWAQPWPWVMGGPQPAVGASVHQDTQVSPASPTSPVPPASPTSPAPPTVPAPQRGDRAVRGPGASTTGAESPSRKDARRPEGEAPERQQVKRQRI
jgi:hypothetical protein